MGALSSNQTIVRYQVQPMPDADITSTVLQGLKKYAMPEAVITSMDEDVVGWVPWATPYSPDFHAHPIRYNDVFLFSLRIDKKTVPAAALKQQLTVRIEERKKETGQTVLSKSEIRDIREAIQATLLRKVPYTPQVFELAWDCDLGMAYFYSAQKAAMDTLETLFHKSFGRRLLMNFPYSQAVMGLDAAGEERIRRLNPVRMGG